MVKTQVKSRYCAMKNGDVRLAVSAMIRHCRTDPETLKRLILEALNYRGHPLSIPQPAGRVLGVSMSAPDGSVLTVGPDEKS